MALLPYSFNCDRQRANKMSSDQHGFKAIEALLKKFEADIERPESGEELARALRELADLRDKFNERCIHVASSYAKLVASHVAQLLGSNSHLHSAVIDHWANLFAKFEDNGFVLPEEAAACRSQLVFRGVLQQVEHLSGADKEILLQRLQAPSDEGHKA